MERKKFKIRKDDTVQVIAGKDKGKRGTIVKVVTKKDAVIDCWYKSCSWFSPSARRPLYFAPLPAKTASKVFNSIFISSPMDQ